MHKNKQMFLFDFQFLNLSKGKGLDSSQEVKSLLNVVSNHVADSLLNLSFPWALITLCVGIHQEVCGFIAQTGYGNQYSFKYPHGWQPLGG